MTKIKQNLAFYNWALRWRNLLLKNLAKWLIKKGVTADMISWLRLFLVIPMFFVIGSVPIWAAIIILLNFFFDALDGVIARTSETASIKGRALDVTIDNFYVIPLVLSLIWFNLANSFWGAFYLVNIISSFSINYIRSGIEIGQFPFSYSKYFIYLALLFWIVNLGNYFDYALIFWSVYLLIESSFNIYKLYNGHE